MAEWYVAYLRSPHWNALRQRILDKRGRKCEDCGRRWKPTCHHLTYVRIGHERQSDLRILCPKCHRQAHRWHHVPFLYLIYEKDFKGLVRATLRELRMTPDFPYPRLRAKVQEELAQLPTE